MALRISLKDSEKVIVNGAVLRAQGRVSLEIENSASILRGRDVMRPEEADTPARRLYFATMLAYVDQANRGTLHDRVLDLVRDLVDALVAPEAIGRAIAVAQHVAADQHYRALQECRWLIAYEAEVLARPAAASEPAPAAEAAS